MEGALPRTSAVPTRPRARTKLAPKLSPNMTMDMDASVGYLPRECEREAAQGGCEDQERVAAWGGKRGIHGKSGATGDVRDAIVEVVAVPDAGAVEEAVEGHADPQRLGIVREPQHEQHREEPAHAEDGEVGGQRLM